MSRLSSLLRHSTGTQRTAAQTCFEKSPAADSVKKTAHPRLSVPIDLSMARSATQTQLAERSCFVPGHRCQMYCSHELRRGGECRKNWKPQHNPPGSRLREDWGQLC